jgi:small-conductance mechanosensitive channel
VNPRDAVNGLFAAVDLAAIRAPLGALVTAVVLFGVFSLIKRFGAGQLARLASRTDTRLDDQVGAAVGGTHPLAMAALAAWMSAALWLPETRAARWTSQFATLALLAQVGAWAGLFVQEVARGRREAAMAAGHPADATAWTALSFLVRLALWSLLALVALDNVGIDVTALVAGLGIGGLAIGLAVQNVLGDLLASLAIVLDRPFSIGDFLVVGEVVGTVEHVGLKTTRLRALSGEQVVVSNADLLGSRIHNFQRLEERRVVLCFGVLYDTPPDQLATVPALVRALVEAQKDTRLDRAHLFRLGDSSIDFEVVYYVASSDYNRHMDVQQAVLLSLIRRFADLDIGFAYPTRTLYVHDGRADAIQVDDVARAGA